MAVSPKVSIRKLGKTIVSLGRLKAKGAGKACHSQNHDCHGRDGVSDSETMDSSIFEDTSSFRVEEGPDQRITPSIKQGESADDIPVSPCVEAWTSPRLCSRKVLSPEDEATISPWSSPSLRRRPLTKLNSWLFLSSAHGCTVGPDDDGNDESDSEETTSEHGDDDDVPPLMPVKPAVPKSGFPIDRRMAMQREDSWLTMGVEGVGDSPRCAQHLRTNQRHRGREEIVKLRRSIAPPITSTNSL